MFEVRVYILCLHHDSSELGAILCIHLMFLMDEIKQKETEYFFYSQIIS